MKSLSEQVGVAAPVLFEHVAQCVGFGLAHDAGAAVVTQVFDDHGGGGVGGDEEDFEGWLFGFLGQRFAPFVVGQEEFVIGEFLAVLLHGDVVFFEQGFVDGVAELFGEGEGRFAAGGGSDDEGEEVRVGGASVIYTFDAGETTGKDGKGACEEDVPFTGILEGLAAFEERGGEVRKDLGVEERSGEEEVVEVGLSRDEGR